jgi:hypothetical protein
LTGELIPAALLVMLAFLGRGSATVAVVLLALSFAVGGASSSGSLPNIVDLSPNFAGMSAVVLNNKFISHDSSLRSLNNRIFL